MNKRFFATIILALVAWGSALACTNLIVTRGASTDGSNMVSYAADSHQLYGALYHSPAAKWKAGSLLKVYEWDTSRYLGEIPQVAQTYSTIGNMNEHQLIIGETTYGGRHELEDPEGSIDYGSLIYITLQRAKTAREAIDCIVDLANTHGYASSGESFTIADKEEVWIMELIGKGPGRKGIVWVARRIPDGYISAHANHARITTFPKNDPENCLYAEDVISFAREMGFYEGSDEEFSFSDTYAPLDFGAMRGCEARVWSFFRRFADGMDAYEDYALGHNPANRMPLWVKPNRKISPKDIFDMMRDHYEGTKMDMTTDIGAGGSKVPYRWRPMGFEVDGEEYVQERAIATQQTGFWFVAQARPQLPDPVGGIVWFGTDDAATSPLTPIYCGSTEVPECLSEKTANILTYSDRSMFWITNRIAQFAYLRYDYIGGEVRKVIDEWENAKLAEVAEVDAALAQLGSEKKMKKMATRYSVATAQNLWEKWSDLDDYLMVKYIDGNIKKQDPENGIFLNNGHHPSQPAFPDQPGYSEKFLRAIANDNPILKVVK
ncbi:MAG: C69 family dipeptidase [Tidjanibacter sp.]|nr:C69 family dipeptidase [Tidjanibacter sp.]